MFRPITMDVKRLTLVATASLVVFALAGCGGGSDRFADPGDPIGAAVLPDIVPTPPEYVQMFHTKGRWNLAFSSTLVNIGNGPLILRATRGVGDSWLVEQIVEHAGGGGEVVPLEAELVWGGDGHNHWHISRVAINRLVQIGPDGKPPTEGGRADAKVGFCFYDHTKRLRKGPASPQYVHQGCGKLDANRIGMGLSPGWEDIYPFVLPGQTIDVTDLPDGKYRMWVTADESGWFRDANLENNVTWVDLELSTKGANRFAGVVATGPTPPGKKRETYVP